MDKELVMYSRTSYCPFVSIAKKVLARENVPYREILIDQDPNARQRLLDWTGFLPVPTLIVARPGEDLPDTPPADLPKGKSPRGIDRGSMISEPSATQLTDWLKANGFIGG